MADSMKTLVFFFVYFNVFLSVADRVTQIVYFSITKFINQTVSNTLLAFIVIYPSVNILMMTLYLLSQNDYGMSVKRKIKFFFMYLFYSEFGFSVGVHKTFKSKYSIDAENIIITTRVINAMHIIFVSLPQLLIITVHSSSVGEFKAIDIISLTFSCLFFFWSILYYVFCCLKEFEIETELGLEEYVN